MSERPPVLLTLSTRNVSADGTRVTPGDKVAGVELTPVAALAALRAFTRVPNVDFVEIDAKIILAGPRGKFSVQNVGGKLFVTRVPEAGNTAIECTPEVALLHLTEADPAAATTIAAAAAAEEAELIAAVAQMPAGPRAWINSVWLIAVMTVVTFAVGYFSFAPDVPAGVEIIRDPNRTSNLHTDFDGRYGDPAATVLVLDHGRLTGQHPGATAGAGENIFELNYRYGLRDGQVVIVVDNGALLEPQPDKSLVFLESRYPKLVAK